MWRRFISSMGYPAEITDPLLSADGLMEMLDGFPIGMARQFHACTHTTFSPNIVHGGSKINTIPDMVELEVDIRTLPGQTDEDIQALLAVALGDLADRVEIVVEASDMSSASPLDTPLVGHAQPGDAALLRGQRHRAVPHRRAPPTRGSSAARASRPTATACSASR